MGWPRVVTGAAARILSMVTDIAQASVRRSDCANGYQQQSSNKEGRTINSKWLWAYVACLDGADPPFSICVVLPCHLPAGQCWRGQMPQRPMRDALRGNPATDVAAWVRRST